MKFLPDPKFVEIALVTLAFSTYFLGRLAGISTYFLDGLVIFVWGFVIALHLWRTRKSTGEARVHRRDRNDFLTLLNLAPAPIVAYGKRGRILFHNEAFRNVFIRNSMNRDENATLAGLFAGTSLLDVYDNLISKRILTHTSLLEWRGVRGGVKTYKVLSQSLLGRACVFLFHETTEITEARRKEQAFVADASHELKTPLALMKGAVDWMELSSRFERSKEWEILKRNLYRMSRLVADLLDLAHVDSDASQTEKICLHGCLEELVDEISRRDQRHGYELRATEEARKALVSMPPLAVEQVIRNLLENAERYALPDTNLEIDLYCDANNNDLILDIDDSGPGIEPQHFAHVFDRFYRLDQHRNRANGGTGLGLALVKARVEAAEGQVVLLASARGGSLFRVRLPRANPWAAAVTGVSSS